MKRRLLMGLVMALALSLSACGGSESTGSEGTENVTQSENTSAGDNKDADTEKESEKETQKKEVSLESLASLEVAPAEDFEVMNVGDGVAICGYKGKDEMVVVPEEIDGEKVVAIFGKAFGEGSGVKAVKIPDTVVEIAEGFTDNEELQYVIFGNGLKKIDMCAFQNCAALIRVELPEGVEKLGINAFAGAVNLEYIYIPDSVVEMEVTSIFCDASKCVIAGKAGSVAEEYANQWEYTFEAVE